MATQYKAFPRGGFAVIPRLVGRRFGGTDRFGCEALSGWSPPPAWARGRGSACNVEVDLPCSC